MGCGTHSLNSLWTMMTTTTVAKELCHRGQKVLTPTDFGSTTRSIPTPTPTPTTPGFASTTDGRGVCTARCRIVEARCTCLQTCTNPPVGYVPCRRWWCGKCLALESNPCLYCPPLHRAFVGGGLYANGPSRIQSRESSGGAGIVFEDSSQAGVSIVSYSEGSSSVSEVRRHSTGSKGESSSNRSSSSGSRTSASTRNVATAGGGDVATPGPLALRGQRRPPPLFHGHSNLPPTRAARSTAMPVPRLHLYIQMQLCDSSMYDWLAERVQSLSHCTPISSCWCAYYLYYVMVLTFIHLFSCTIFLLVCVLCVSLGVHVHNGGGGWYCCEQIIKLDVPARCLYVRRRARSVPLMFQSRSTCSPRRCGESVMCIVED